MKLLLCEHCYDVFALSDKLRTCECGRVKGRYINERDAEVSPEGVSLVISSKTLPQAIDNMRRLQAETGDMARRNDYRQANQGRIEEVWVRPNTGPGNPHTRIIEGEEHGTLDKQYLKMPLPDRHNIVSGLRGVT